MPIPTAVSIELTDDERSVLESWTRRRTSAQALALRARIVLMAAEGLWSNGEIAEALAGFAADGHEVAQPVRSAPA
jgi:hypothetical protein